MSWQQALERTVTGMGYDVVDVERSAGGLLRVTIDRLPGHAYATGPGDSVLVEDCELVTRQLQYLLEVEAVDYGRLEVSSPGLDRPLKKPADWQRFVGAEVEVTLRQPFQNRRRWRGVLAAADGAAVAGGDGASQWRIELTPETPARPGRNAKGGTAAKGPKGAKAAKSTQPAAAEKAGEGSRAVDAVRGDLLQVLDFSLDEVREARLVPVVDFKGRRAARPAEAEAGSFALADKEDGGQD